MKRSHIITISGKPGSGKSSTADRVAELLGYTRFSSGDTVRKMIRKQNITLEEYNKKAEDNPELDNKIDEELRELRNHKDIVIDSRLGFHWIPESFKVYLDLDPEVAMARIYKDANLNALRDSSHEGDSMNAVIEQVNGRMGSERSRFHELYKVNPFAVKHFDLIIDTSRHSPETVALTVFDNYKKWLSSTSWKQVISRVPMGYSFKN